MTDNVTLLSFCSFQRFSSLLLSAEYAFYWNSLSHSMLFRLINRAPVFQFDKGHLVRNVKPLYKRIVHCYYQGWNPIYLDQEKELNVEKLSELAAEYRAAADRVCRLMRRAPSPEEMIAGIERKHGRTGNKKESTRSAATKATTAKRVTRKPIGPKALAKAAGRK
jgi:hypothetical protein